MSVTKGHVTIMWNKLFKIAYDENCDYFFQCGDDIYFRTSNWINDCISTLKNNNDIGITGPINNNSRILTQAFVSRKHMELFGYFFPEEIKNWFCDDWITKVYYSKYFYQINHFASNIGGEPKYKVIGEIMNPEDPTFKACNRLIIEGKQILHDYCSK